MDTVFATSTISGATTFASVVKAIAQACALVSLFSKVGERYSDVSPNDLGIMMKRGSYLSMRGLSVSVKILGVVTFLTVVGTTIVPLASVLAHTVRCLESREIH